MSDKSDNQNFSLDYRLKGSRHPEVTPGQSQTKQEGRTRHSVQSIQLSAARSGPAVHIAGCGYNRAGTTAACCSLLALKSIPYLKIKVKPTKKQKS